MSLTSVNARVASVRFDERPHEWRSVHDPRGYSRLIADILTPPPADSPRWVHGLRTIIIGEHPYDPAVNPATPMLLVAVGTVHDVIMGAAYYRQFAHNSVSAWTTVNPQPMPDAPVFAFSSQGWNSFPADAVIDAVHLRELVTEYLTSGHRPECVAWRESDFVQ